MAMLGEEQGGAVPPSAPDVPVAGREQAMPESGSRPEIGPRAPPNPALPLPNPAGLLKGLFGR